MVKRVKKVKKKVSRKKTDKLCPHCHIKIEGLSRFCKHCGGSFYPKTLRRKHHCPSCRGIVEEFSRFCKHCGANIDTFIHTKTVKFFMYLAIFLIIALALLLFFAPTSVDKTDEVTIDVGKSFVKVSDSFCSWQDDSFRACTTVNWKGDSDDYIVCDFGDGILDGQKIYQSPFTCCSDVDEGLNLAKAYLFSEDGKNYEDDGTSVTCSGKPDIYIPSSVKTTNYKKNIWFHAKETEGHGDGYGVIYVNFPGKVQSCEFDGYFELKSSAKLDFCNNAKGVFSGAADLYGQSVFTDPGEYRWAGATFSLMDPVGKLFEGYSVYFWTCDPTYHKSPKYYVKGKFSGFGTKILELNWEYYNEYPRPDANVFLNLDCQII